MSRKVISQRIGRMFDDLDMKSKIDLATRLDWMWRDVKGVYHDVKSVIRNHIKWHKTLRQIRPWEGFDGLFSVVRTHLAHYAALEKKYGSSVNSSRKRKIASATQALKLLKRLQDPSEYSNRRLDKVKAKYPAYKSLITEYTNGSTSFSGSFVAQGAGWAGRESGKDPREGYFEFVGGRFELLDSPDHAETNRLLSELDAYHQDRSLAYQLAQKDADRDFARLCKLFKEHLYTWWD